MVLDFKNPFGLVQSQPQLNLPSTITPITPPTQKPTIGNKNQQLGSMLYALGGALRGDKNFVENTMQLQNIQDAKKREKEMKENWQKALGNLEGSVNPTLVELARVVGPEKGAGLIASGIGKEKKLTADQENYKLAVKQGYEGTFMDYMKEKKAPLVTIDQGQKVFEQEAAKAGFKTQQQAAETVEGYSDIENRLDILAKQLEGADPVKTGVIEEIKIPFKKIAAGLNILPQNELDKLSQQELFQATTNYIIPRMRVAGSGSTSDREIELFKSSVPNLGNTVEGNKTLVGGLQAIAKYNKKRLFEMDKYLKNNGNLLGFGEFADNQLGPIYETFTSDDDFDKKVRAGKLKKGDFVYDAISGQFRVLSEADIKGAL
jgi:hypothetical protein